MYNIILCADTAYSYSLARGHGIQRLASELRNLGYSVLLLNYTSTLDLPTFERILDIAVGVDTLFVGFSTTFFPYRSKDVDTTNNRRSIGTRPNQFDEYNRQDHPWYFQSLPYHFTQESIDPWIMAVKNRNPKTKFIVGGTKSGEYIQDSLVDHVFVGYSETMMIEFANSLSGKGKRILFNKVIDYDPGAEKPIWNFRSSRTWYTEEDIVLPADTLGFEFARGCIFNCAFCSFPLIGKKDVNDFLRYEQSIHDELVENYNRWGITKYFIVDDTFNDSVDKLEIIHRVVTSLPFKLNFWAYARLDLLNSHPRMAELMLEMGVKEVNYGLETLHPETAKAIRKGNPEVKKKGVKIARSIWGKDVFIGSGYIVGLPKETQASVRAANQWFLDEGHKYIDELQFNALTLARKMGNQTIYLSDIEKYSEKYGYTPLYDRKGGWTKNDGSDITHRDQCLDLIAEIQQTRNDKQFYSTYKNLFHISCYETVDSRLNFDNLEALSLEEFKEIESTTDTQTLIRKFADEVYWPKLFELLQKKVSL